MPPTPAPALAEQGRECPALSSPLPRPACPPAALATEGHRLCLGSQSQSQKGTSWTAGAWMAFFMWSSLNSLLLFRVHATEAEGGEGVMAPEKQPGRRKERRGAGEIQSLHHASPPSPAPCRPSLPAGPLAAHCNLSTSGPQSTCLYFWPFIGYWGLLAPFLLPAHHVI